MTKPNIATFLLCDFIKLGRRDNAILEIGTGKGWISSSLSSLYSRKFFVGIDLQKEDFFSLKSNLFYLVGDARREKVCFKPNSFDVIVTNPPFYSNHYHRESPFIERKLSRSDRFFSLEDLFSSSRYLLKERGKIFFIHSAFRFAEIVKKMTEFDFWPQEVNFVITKKDKPAELVLIKGIFKGKGDTKIFFRNLELIK